MVDHHAKMSPWHLLRRQVARRRPHRLPTWRQLGQLALILTCLIRLVDRFACQKTTPKST